ncbi:MAG: flagellar hook-length control protein FliK [Actinomycetes bacterium]
MLLPPDLAAQVALRVLPLRRTPDGTTRLSVQLTPAELGRVELTVQVRGGLVHLHLTSADPLSREALRAALPDLRRELGSAGLATGQLDVSGGAPGSAGGQQPSPGWQHPLAPPEGWPVVTVPRPDSVPLATPLAPGVRQHGSGAIDLRL